MKISDFKCCICGHGPETDGRALFRINAKGPGIIPIMACKQHIGQTDGKIDKNVGKLVDAIQGKP